MIDLEAIGSQHFTSAHVEVLSISLKVRGFALWLEVSMPHPSGRLARVLHGSVKSWANHRTHHLPG